MLHSLSAPCSVRVLHQGISEPLPREEHPRQLASPCSPADLQTQGWWPHAIPVSTAPDPVDMPDLSYLSYPNPCVETPEKTDADTTNDHKTVASLPPVYLCHESTSSMDVAHRLIKLDALPVWGSVLTLQQQAGRGQLGRQWVSPVGNVYGTVRLPYHPPFTTTAAAPAVGGLLAAALAELGAPVQVKWPNDLLQRDALTDQWCKVGGILLEERSTPPCAQKAQQEPALVAGIGLNLASFPPRHTLREDHAFPAGKLWFDKSVENPLSSAPELWLRLVSRLFFCYVKTIGNKGEDAWRPLVERHLAFLGQPVVVVDGFDGQERHQGILEGLDNSGGLRLRNTDNCLLSGSLYPL